MKRFCVRFSGDNDFINTVVPFVKALGAKVFAGYGGYDRITKEHIVQLFNDHAYTFYVMYQKYELQILPDERMKGYLQISVKDVYFDDEIQAFCDSGQWNGDGCVAHMDHEGKVQTYVI